MYVDRIATNEACRLDDLPSQRYSYSLHSENTHRNIRKLPEEFPCIVTLGSLSLSRLSRQRAEPTDDQQLRRNVTPGCRSASSTTFRGKPIAARKEMVDNGVPMEFFSRTVVHEGKDSGIRTRPVGSRQTVWQSQKQVTTRTVSGRPAPALI